MNPFKLADELIKRNYRIPIFNDAIPHEIKDDWIPEIHNNSINLSELLLAIRNSYEVLFTENEVLKSKCGEYESVLKEYAKRPTRIWTSGYPGQYDPMSGFHGQISGETDNYKEARALAVKWGLLK